MIMGVEGRQGIDYYNKYIGIRRRYARYVVSGIYGYTAVFMGIYIGERISRAGQEEQRGGYGLPENKVVVE